MPAKNWQTDIQMNKKLDYRYCKAAPVLEWMSHKWALVILLCIEDTSKQSSEHKENTCLGTRFGDLFREIPGISEKMLASTLDYLESEELASRNEHDTFPPCVEYTVTPLGKSFLREIGYIIEWGHLHFEEINKARNSRQQIKKKQ